MNRTLPLVGVWLLSLLLAVRGSPALAAGHGGHGGSSGAAHSGRSFSVSHAGSSHSFSAPHASFHYAAPHAAWIAPTPSPSHSAIHTPATGTWVRGGGSSVPHVAAVPRVTPNTVNHAQFSRYYYGNRGWNGYYYHHPWVYIPYAYSIYPYTYGLALGSTYYGYGSGVPAYSLYNNTLYNDTPIASGPLAATYSDSYPPATEYTSDSAPPPPLAAESAPQFYAQAVTAFSAGNYEEAVRLADHAIVDAPKDARTHELLSLAMFALGDYRGAAIEAHAAISLGPIGNWAGIQAYYNNPDTYSTQLRKLESYVLSHPKAADAHFLLGYQYSMLDHADAAKYQFQAAHQLTPDDALAAKLAGN